MDELLDKNIIFNKFDLKTLTDIKTEEESKTKIESIFATSFSKQEDESNGIIVKNYPYVYLYVFNTPNLTNIYVGETFNIINRTQNHIREANSYINGDQLKENDNWHKYLSNSNNGILMTFTSKHFNKSMTLDIENELIHYCSALSTNTIKLHNGRPNPQGMYSNCKLMPDLFNSIRDMLISENNKLFLPKKDIEQNEIFKLSPAHKLTQLQAEQKRKIINAAFNKLAEYNKEEANNTGNQLDNKLIIIQGDAGTGKSVLISNIFYELLFPSIGEDEEFPSEEHKFRPNKGNINTYLLVNHNEQLNAFKKIGEIFGLRFNESNKQNMINQNPCPRINKPMPFINEFSRNMSTDGIPLEKADIVFIDEAHLLNTVSDNGTTIQHGNKKYGSASNFLDEIRKRSKVTIAIYDPNQMLQSRKFMLDNDYISMINNPENLVINLDEQLRMRFDTDGSVSKWLKQLIYGTNSLKTINNFPNPKDYDLKIFDSVIDMHNEIKKLNQKYKLCRMAATYDWEFSATNKNKKYKVSIDDPKYNKKFELNRNYQLPVDKDIKYKDGVYDKPFCELDKTIDEVGSTFTLQGFDLNYVGLIIGPSVTLDDNGNICYKTELKCSSRMKERYTDPSDQTKTKVDISESLCKNELNILSTRGIRGLYIYAVDEKLRNALLCSQKNCKRK